MTPSTTRSQSAAKQIQMNYLLVRDHPMMGQVAEEELASVIASHYAELEAAAVLARDALLDTDKVHALTAHFYEPLSALDAALGTTPRINTNVVRAHDRAVTKPEGGIPLWNEENA